MTAKEIILNGNKIKYIKQEGRGSDTFVFLHGWGSNFKSFAPIYNSLDSSYMAFDFPASNKNTKLFNAFQKEPREK